ncbi:MAG TPA: GGDEF domain-containing protein [Glycomyces sp.]|nr:GGDEF domain-containing protein [Glycomyces sp.]
MSVIRRQHPRLFRVLPWAFTGLMFGTVVAGLFYFGRPANVPVLQLAGFTAGFAVAHTMLIIQYFRRHRIAYSLADIPLVLALFYLDPFWVVAVRLVSSAIIYGRRYVVGDLGALKPLFNTALTSLGAGSAALLAHLVGLGPADDPYTWLVLIGATILAGVTTTFLISVMLLIIDGWKSVVQAWSGFLLNMVGPLLAASAGVICLILLEVTAWAGILVALLAVAMIFFARNYIRLRRQHQVLAQLNDFTQLVSDSVRSNRLIDAMLGRLREILSAEAATVWVPADGRRYPEIRLTADVDDVGLTDLDPIPRELQAQVIAERKSMFLGPKTATPAQRELLESAGLRSVMLVPLRAGDDVYGCLSVADRIGGEASHFFAIDLQLLETVAAHVSVAVDNARLVDQLRYDAYHDPVTGLANRRRSLAALQEALAITVPGEVVAVLMFDVDGMHELNDALGHEAGDALLVEFGRRLAAHAPDASFIGRIDSDEFLLQTRLPSTEAAVETARTLRERLKGPFEFGGVAVEVSAAVGVVTHPDFATDADELLQRADTATRQAKRAGDGVQSYHSGLESESLRRIGLAADLRRALDREDLEVHFQPKVALDGAALSGAEALVRWPHPTYGPVAPEEFIAIAASTGQLGRLTELVLAEALRRSTEWAREDGPLPMAVNLSPRTLADTAFPDRVAELLARHRVPPGRLTFEITEDDMVSDGSRLTPVLDRLHEMGVRLSVDDFGTGYSSLAYLRRLPIQEIKIDLRFVQGMATDADDRAIVKAVIGLARHFEIDVVAEGIETHRTVEELLAMGCGTGQGYYFSRPLPPDRFATWLGAQGGEEGPA